MIEVVPVDLWKKGMNQSFLLEYRDGILNVCIISYLFGLLFNLVVADFILKSSISLAYIFELACR